MDEAKTFHRRKRKHEINKLQGTEELLRCGKQAHQLTKMNWIEF